MKHESKVIILFLGVSALVYFAYWSQTQSQFVRPAPWVPAPVVPQLPNIAATLGRIKASSEGRAAAGKRYLESSRQIRARVQLKRGAEVYSDHVAEVGSLIDFLKSGALIGFRETDDAAIRIHLDRANRSYEQLLEWGNSIENKSYGDSGWFPELLSQVNDFLKGVNEQNDATRNEIIRQLESCRLSPWSDSSGLVVYTTQPIATPSLNI